MEMLGALHWSHDMRKLTVLSCDHGKGHHARLDAAGLRRVTMK